MQKSAGCREVPERNDSETGVSHREAKAWLLKSSVFIPVSNIELSKGSSLNLVGPRMEGRNRDEEQVCREQSRFVGLIFICAFSSYKEVLEELERDTL